MKKDRAVAGGIAGFVASVICDIVGLIYKSLGWTDRTFNDYATIILTYQIFSDDGIFGLILSMYSTLSTALLYGLMTALTLKIIDRKMNLV